MAHPESLPRPLIPLNSPQATLESVGSKAMNLAVLARSGFPVPDGFFIPVSCYRNFVEIHDLDSVIEAILPEVDPSSPAGLEAASAEIRSRFSRHSISEDIRSKLAFGWEWLGSKPVAVRSSATAEDLPDMSFAGQQDTYLNVIDLQALIEAVVNCWSSLWTARAIGYRGRNKLPHHGLSLCVVVQHMVQSEASGVMFTANPLTGCRREILIDATLGLGEALVGGQVQPDHFVLSSDLSIKKKTSGDKALIITADDRGGVITRKVKPSPRQAIPDEAITQLAELAGEIADLFEHPQDIEWAYLNPQPGEKAAEGQFYILQSRPITTLFPLPAGMAPDPLKIMLGFHVIQGINEPLTPLGQDTLKLVLTGAGRMFKLHHSIETQTAFYSAAERLWINITSLLRNPIGYRVIPRILKALDHGVSSIVQELIADPRFIPDQRRPSLKTLHRLAVFFVPFVLKVIQALHDPEKHRGEVILAFDEVVVENQALQGSSGDLWHDFNQRLALLHNAGYLFSDFVIPKGVPLVVAGMVLFFGILERFSRQVAEATGNPQFNTCHMEIAQGLPYNVTIEMDLDLWAAAKIIRADPEAASVFETSSAAELAAAYKTASLPTEAQGAIQDFLMKYGVRGVGEIDIGRVRWQEDPTQVMQFLQSYLKITDPFMAPDAVFKRGIKDACEASRKLVDAVLDLPGGSIKARMVRFAVDRYRALAGMREAPKFFAVRMMGIIRQGLLASGKEFVEAGLLVRSDDLFFLNISELDEVAIRRQFPEDICTRIEGRRLRRGRELLRKQLPRVLMSDGTTFYEGITSPEGDGRIILGDPVSQGLAEGKVRVILDPFEDQLIPGEILVCPGTDPAWTPLFLAAAGLVMEVGGMMTHGSVVAREYGIPAVVGVHQATTRLETGQRVRLDGNKGIIEVCD
jgi:phosphohistidine swiveling domain-containing protein